MDFNDFNSMIKKSQVIPKSEIQKLNTYFAQYGSTIRTATYASYYLPSEGSKVIREPNIHISTKGIHFNIFKLEGDDEWFGLSVYKSGSYQKVTDKFAFANMGKPEFTDERGFSMITKAEWYYTDRKPGYEGCFIKKTPDLEEFLKCDQIGGVLETIDTYMGKRQKKDPEIHISKIKRKSEFDKMRKDARRIIQGFSYEELEDFLKSRNK